MKGPIAIIGNGGAAAEAVLALRANGYAGDIHLFADNRHAPYNPMLGPYLVAGKIPLERAFPFGDGPAFYGGQNVTTHLGDPVARLDAEAQELMTASGFTQGYSRCLVATGARAAVPPIAGLRELVTSSRGAAAGARRVFTIQTLDDALALRQAADELVAHRRPGSWPGRSPARAPAGPRTGARGGKAAPAPSDPRPRAAVIGASFAGVKVAAVLHDLGFAVTLVEKEASILPLAAHPEAARVLETHLLAEGYELRLGAALAGVRLQEAAADLRGGAPDVPPGKIHLDFGALPGAADPGGAGGTACEESAAQEEVDLLVVCTGNRPALDFLVPGQVDVGTGILVDDQMRASIPTLFAAGDVAQGRNLLSGRREIIGLWSSARFQGRAAGRGLAGLVSGYQGGVPHNVTHVGRILFAGIGCVDDYDDVTTTREGGSWQVRLWRDGRLVGVNLVGSCLSAGVVKQALARATMATTEPAAAEAAAGVKARMEATWTSFSA